MIYSPEQTLAVSPSMNRKVIWVYLLLLFLSYIVSGKTYIGQSKNGKHFLISTKHRKNPHGPLNLHDHKKKILKIHKSKKKSMKYAKKKKLSKENISKEAGNHHTEAGNDYAEDGNEHAETARPLGSIYTSTYSVGTMGNKMLCKC